jgi:hypothetical protein
MSRVTSKDGTSIAYDLSGGGPAVILVGGGLDDGTENGPLVPELRDRFAVYNYARRGASIPRAERTIFEGQGHVADPHAIAPALQRFFTTTTIA